MALITCRCGITSRLPRTPKGKVRCARCKHVFTPTELCSAKPEAAPAPLHLEQEDDDWDEEGFDEEDE
jgi:hypothetical protein